jgi:hypothetical protein
VSENTTQTTEVDAPYDDAEVLALMRLLAPVVEYRRHYGLRMEDAEVYARAALEAGYRRVLPPGSSTR